MTVNSGRSSLRSRAMMAARCTRRCRPAWHALHMLPRDLPQEAPSTADSADSAPPRCRRQERGESSAMMKEGAAP